MTEELKKHNWIGLCSDINTHWNSTYQWYRCSNCKKETEHTKTDQKKPSDDGCTAKEEGNIFPLSSI